MFSELLEQFRSNITGLRDFVDLIKPMLNEYHKKEKEKFDKAFIPLKIAQQIEIEVNPDLKTRLQEELKEIFDGEIIVKIESENDSTDQESKKGKQITFNVKGDIRKMDEAFDFQIKSDAQRNLLYVNSLISLLSSAEWFYSQLLHYYYDKNPNSAGIKKKTLSLEDLQSFGSVQDAEKYLIDSKIENILRSSFIDWIDTLKNELSLGLGYMDEFQAELIEIYQRRNLFVHNGGIINSIYLSKVPSAKSNKMEIGSKLYVDEGYLENAINKIHVIFSLIACELWKKDKPEDEERATFLMELSYNYLKRGKWEIAQLPNIFLTRDAKMPLIPKTYAQLNCWLCKKRLGNPNLLIAELKNIDYSDKSIVIQLALSSLREDKEKFFEELPKAINSEELSIDNLFDFPILKEMREANEFEKFKRENEKIKQYIEENGAQHCV